MDRQHDFWSKEHENQSSIPSMHALNPDDGVVYFFEFLKNNGFNHSVAADIGCGKGRNSIFMAKSGSDVYAMEYVESALDFLKRSAEENKLGRVHPIKGRMDAAWPFDDNFFDIVVDSYSSIDIDNFYARKKCRDEMFRTLKKGGHALVMVVSAEDELERKFIEKNPGMEKNSCIWPNGKFQKDYDRNELLDFYKKFNVIELKEIKKPALRLGRNYTATNYWLIIQKPKN